MVTIGLLLGAFLLISADVADRRDGQLHDADRQHHVTELPAAIDDALGTHAPDVPGDQDPDLALGHGDEGVGHLTEPEADDRLGDSDQAVLGQPVLHDLPWQDLALQLDRLDAALRQTLRQDLPLQLAAGHSGLGQQGMTGQDGAGLPDVL